MLWATVHTKLHKVKPTHAQTNPLWTTARAVVQILPKKSSTDRAACIRCVLVLDGQRSNSKPGDNEVLVDCTAMSLQALLSVCTFVQTGHALLLSADPRAVPQTVMITCGGSVSVYYLVFLSSWSVVKAYKCACFMFTVYLFQLWVTAAAMNHPSNNCLESLGDNAAMIVLWKQKRCCLLISNISIKYQSFFFNLTSCCT